MLIRNFEQNMKSVKLILARMDRVNYSNHLSVVRACFETSHPLLILNYMKFIAIWVGQEQDIFNLLGNKKKFKLVEFF